MMREDVFAWAAFALVLFVAEALLPGAFMLWLAFAATALFLLTWLLPEIPLLAQMAIFVVLSFVSIQVYRRWFRKCGPVSDQPALNRRTAALIGRVVPLETAIIEGHGRVQIADALWEVAGPDAPAGTPVRVVGAEDAMTLQVELA
jgi:inner membrane protein